MKSLTKRPPYELIQLTLFCLLVAGLAWVYFWQIHGVGRRPNASLVGLIAVVAALGLGGLGLSTLFCSLISFSHSSWRWFTTGILASAAAFAVLASPSHLVQTAATLAERREFTAAGIPQLRDEVQHLINTRPPFDAAPDRVRWFGTEVPRETLSPGLRALAARAAYVAVNEREVIIVTEGMGGWRAGYLILPSGATRNPPYSRRIADGIYYVTSTTGG
ncbi:hypothetical protein [Verrucomicrobium sp. BvORR034]|uniref:hypothetical protein n=1 Tax=Verrucomicrobium sp. BvORR034 TaxID=1396418 RepID=UPI0006791610|nr:hypothetical protein [Verrucomicrobium sp. BvORR034]